MRPSILITETQDYSAEALAIYARLGQVVLGQDDINYRPNSVQGLVVRLGQYFSAEVLECWPQLKWIVSPTTAIDHIDQNYCGQKKIEIFSLKGHQQFLSHITSTAEHTFALILNLLRQVNAAHLDVTVNYRWDRDQFKGPMLSTLKLGIIGLGRIGSKVSKYAQAFGMEVYACDPHISSQRFRDLNVTSCSIEELLMNSDVISLHLNSSAENKNFLHAPLLQKIKKSAYLINTSRGDLLDERELLRLLQNGHLKGAALDVISDEITLGPISQQFIHFARHSSKLILTPHLGGACPQAMIMTENFMANLLWQKFYSNGEIHGQA